MATYSKRKLSASTDGKGILVAATATPGTAIHTAVSGTADLDEIYLKAVNTSASAVKITVEFGGVTAPNDHIEYTVPAEDGLHLIIDGLLLHNGATVAAFAATANVLVIHGHVHRITA